jgi:hypothetical protein
MKIIIISPTPLLSYDFAATSGIDFGYILEIYIPYDVECTSFYSTHVVFSRLASQYTILSELEAWHLRLSLARKKA